MTTSLPARSRGFTLVEIMITVAIVGLLTAVALPNYRDYVTRSRLTDAFSGLAAVQPQAEQFWSNNRSFAGFDRLPTNTANFTFGLSNDSATTYTVTATGIGDTAGFVYTINQSGGRATTGAPSGWSTNATCWVDSKSGKCVG